MALRPTYKIDRRALMAEMNVAEPVFKKEAERIMREEFFEPAVVQMMMEFNGHLVTQEIRGGVKSLNLSNTLEGNFKNTSTNKNAGHDDSPPNLYSYIGFDPRDGDPLEPIEKRLSPDQASGPKMVYQGKDRNQMVFRFEIKAPSEQVIYNETGMPWAKGSISWAKRIEQGIPGIGQYLNVKRNSPDPSRSGGGIQVKGDLPGRIRYRPVLYLSGIFRNFLKRATGGR